MKKQSGFTLIELMIVVAIVAILAAIALPAYQSYTLKARFTEVISAVAPYKTAMEVCVQTHVHADGDFPDNTQSTGGCVTPETDGIPPSVAGQGANPAVASGNVASVDIAAADGSITATGGANVNNLTYVLTPAIDNAGKMTWTVGAASTCIAAGAC